LAHHVRVGHVRGDRLHGDLAADQHIFDEPHLAHAAATEHAMLAVARAPFGRRRSGAWWSRQRDAHGRNAGVDRARARRELRVLVHRRHHTLRAGGRRFTYPPGSLPGSAKLELNDASYCLESGRIRSTRWSLSPIKMASPLDVG